MECILLGTASAIGMPAPCCSCPYCNNIERTRPSLLVRDEDNTLLFDLSPDISRQTHNNDVHSIDSIFLTHHHHDHASGIKEINHTTLQKSRIAMNHNDISQGVIDWLDKEYDLYCSPETIEVLNSDMSYILDNNGFTTNTMNDCDTVKIGNIKVTSFITEHCHSYLGYHIESDEKSVVYHPDYGALRTDFNFENVDYLVLDGSSYLGYDIHGTLKDSQTLVEEVEPDNIIYTNVSEHIAQAPTSELKKRAESSPGHIVKEGYQF